MLTVFAATTSASTRALWYLTRGTGIVTLLLLTLSVVLGVMNVRRSSTPQMPRFVLQQVHRNASLLALAFLFVHIATTLIDGFAPIRLIDVVIPFASPYRPLWLGFGTLASDLLIAIAITSLLRRRLGYSAWRATHWAAYACWPIALLHGLGTGSDPKTGWMLIITGVCVIAVIVAVISRATSGWPEHRGARLTALGASALVPLGLLVWLPSGPLAAGWARRAGTPAALLRAFSPAASSTSTASASSSPAKPSGGATSGFTASVSGPVTQGTSDGLVTVDMTLAVHGPSLNRLAIRIDGQPADGGGVAMTSSRVYLGSGSNPHAYHGHITALNGSDILALVRDDAGHFLRLHAQLQIDQNHGAATGTLSAVPTGGN